MAPAQSDVAPHIQNEVVGSPATAPGMHLHSMFRIVLLCTGVLAEHAVAGRLTPAACYRCWFWVDDESQSHGEAGHISRGPTVLV